MTRIKKVTQSIPSSGLVLNEYADSETDTYSTAYVNDQLDEKQGTLTAGAGITIDENNEISADGSSYTAGTGLTLNDHEFSIDTTVVAEKSDIPTVNNATLTVQQNGSDIATFTANSSTNATASITVPTKTSDLANDGASGTGTYAESSAVTAVANDVTTINGKIPAQASTSNQLADKAFVNSSVQTATANFRGNWDNWTDVQTDASLYPVDYAGSTTPTVNDYMVLQDASDFPVGAGEDPLTGTWRFKYSGVWSTNGKNGWHPEYQVNETPLTAEQLAALNSGITSTAVTQIGTNTSDISTLQTDVAGKQNTLTPGSNITIDQATGTISATDTTYSDFTGTDGTSAGVAGLVPAPATTDAGKFLKADGTWDSAGEGITLSNPLIARTGFEFLYPAIHKQGNHYFGTITIHKTSGNFTGGDEIAASMSVTPDVPQILAGFASPTQWPATFTPSHVFITNYSSAASGPALLVRSDSANSYIRIQVDFVTTTN